MRNAWRCCTAEASDEGVISSRLLSPVCFIEGAECADGSGLQEDAVCGVFIHSRVIKDRTFIHG